MSNVANNLARDVPKFPHVPHIGPWAAQAACLGTDPTLWFLDDQNGSYREARQICAACPVRPECLRWALDTRTDHGLFGGLNPKERRALRRQAGHLGTGLEQILYLIILFVFIMILLRATGLLPR